MGQGGEKLGKTKIDGKKSEEDFVESTSGYLPLLGESDSD